jgi:hypothetical protein
MKTSRTRLFHKARSAAKIFAHSFIALTVSNCPKPVAAQAFDFAGRLFAGRQQLGGELEAATSHYGLFARAEGVPFASHQVTTLGCRTWAVGDSKHGAYIHGGLSFVRCSTITLGGTSTACDGQVHKALAMGAGVNIGTPESSFSVFADAGVWIGAGSRPDVPAWTFAGGLRYRIPFTVRRS